MFIIDRFEGAWAIIETETRRTFNLPRSVLPLSVEEGDAISIQVGIDVAATRKRTEDSIRRLGNFFDE